jgi:hypothetical protein
MYRRQAGDLLCPALIFFVRDDSTYALVVPFKILGRDVLS